MEKSITPSCSETPQLLITPTPQSETSTLPKKPVRRKSTFDLEAFKVEMGFDKVWSLSPEELRKRRKAQGKDY